MFRSVVRRSKFASFVGTNLRAKLLPKMREENIIPNVSYLNALKIFRKRHNEKEVLSSLMDHLPDYCPSLFKASTCLSIGTGYGEFDIEFIRRCLPNLKKFIAVEKDDQGVEELKVNLNNQFGRKFNVEIYKMPVESFMDLRENEDKITSENQLIESCETKIQKIHAGEIDVVLALHVIFFLNEQNRQRFYKMCSEKWLKPGSGHLIFTNASENNGIVQLMNQLDAYPFLSSKTIREELARGQKKLELIKQMNYKCKMNMSDYDVDLYRMFNFCYKKHSHICQKSIEEAMKVIAPDGVSFNDSDLCTYRRML